jgi:cytochrome c oxidase subunit 1
MGALCGVLILVAWLGYLLNVVMSIGVKGLIGVYTPSKLDTKDLVPAEQA